MGSEDRGLADISGHKAAEGHSRQEFKTRQFLELLFLHWDLAILGNNSVRLCLVNKLIRKICLHAQLCLTLCAPTDWIYSTMFLHPGKNWSGLPFPVPGSPPDAGIEPPSPASRALQADSPTEPLGKIPVGDVSRIYNRNSASQAVVVLKNPPASSGRRCKRG